MSGRTMSDLWPRLLAAFKRPLVWWVVVAEWEQGVRVRLGKSPTLLVPGIHFRIPFLDRVYVQSVRLRTIEDSGPTVTTLDGKVAVVGYALSFSIDDMLTFYQTMSTPEQTLTARASASIARHVSKQKSTDLDVDDIASVVDIGDTSGMGLSPVTADIVGLTVCRAYRMISSGYRSGVGINEMDGER